MMNSLKEIKKECLEKTINILEFFDIFHYDMMQTLITSLMRLKKRMNNPLF